MSLLDDIMNSGESTLAGKVAQAATRSASKIEPQIISRTPYTPKGNYGNDATEAAYETRMNELDASKDKIDSILNEGGLGGYKYQSSDNPVVSTLAKGANLGASFFGGLAQIADQVVAAPLRGETTLQEGMAQPYMDMYQRSLNREKVNTANNRINAYALAEQEGRLSDLVGYDKEFKTQAEYKEAIKALKDQTKLPVTTEEEEAKLDSKTSNAGVSMFATNTISSLFGDAIKSAAGEETGKTYREWIRDIGVNKGEIEKITGNREKGIPSLTGGNMWKSQEATQRFQEDFAANKEGIQGNGIGATLQFAGAAIESLNPMFAGEMVAETLPMLLPQTAIPAIMSDTSRVLNAGLDKSADENGFNTASDYAKAIGAAGAYTALNFAERGLLLKTIGGKGIGDAVADAAGNVAARTSNAVAGRGFTTAAASADEAALTGIRGAARTVADAVPSAGIAKAGTRIGIAGAAEGLVEGAQQYAEGAAGGDFAYNAEEIGQALGLGAALGAGFGAAGEGVRYVGNRAEERTTQALSETYGDANIETAEMLDSTSPNYDIEKGLNRIVDYAQDKNDDTYTPETAATEIQGVVDNLAKTSKQYDGRISLAEKGTDFLNSAIDKFMAVNEKIGEEHPNYARNAAAIKQFTDVRDALANDPNYIQNLKTEKEAIDQDYNYAKQVQTDFNTIVASKQTNEAEGETTTGVDSAVPSSSTDSVDTGTGISVSSKPMDAVKIHLNAPNYENLNKIVELSENTEVPENIRKALRRTADALIAANKKKSSEKVSREVTKGGEGYRGTEQYISEMNKAIDLNDTAAIYGLNNDIDRFLNSRTSKLNAIREAHEIALQTGKAVDVVKTENGPWEVSPVRLSKKAKEQNQAITVQSKPNSIDNLSEALEIDIEAITATRDAMKALSEGTRSVDDLDIESLANDEINTEQFNINDDLNMPSNPVNPVQPVQPVNNVPANNVAQANEMDLAMDTLNENTDIDYSDDAIFDDMLKEVNNAIEADNTDVKNTTTKTLTAGKGDGATIKGAINKAPNNNKESAAAKEPVKQTAKARSDDDKGKANTANETKTVPEKDKVVKRKKVDTRKVFNTKEDADNHVVTSANGASYAVVKSGDKYITVNRKKEQEDTVAKQEVLNEANTVVEDSTQANEQDTASDKQQETTNTKAPDPIAVDSVVVDTAESLDKADLLPDSNIALINTDKENIKQLKKLPINKQNLFITGFFQKKRKAGNSLLTESGYSYDKLDANNKNMLAKVIEKYSGTYPTVESVDQLANMITFFKNTGIVQQIQSSIKPISNMDYGYLQQANFLMEDGKIDKNISEAIAVGIYSWLAENGSYTVTDKKVLSKILHTDSKASIAPAAWELLGDIGYPQDSITMSLGQRIMQSLQLRMQDTADTTRSSALEQTLGNIAVGIMVQGVKVNGKRVPLVQSKAVKTSTIMALSDSSDLNGKGKARKETEKTYKGFEEIFFIRPTTENKIPTAIAKLNEGTKGTLGKLYGYSSNYKPVSLTPVKAVQQKYTSFNRDIPKEAKEALAVLQSTAYTLDMPVVSLADKLINNPNTKVANAFLYALGYDFDADSRHVAFQKSIKSKNEGITRALNSLFDTLDTTQGADFYLEATMWNNMRVGYTNDFDPQGSKIHRGFSSLASDRISVPTDTTIFNSDGITTDYGKFLRALGFRIEDVKMGGNAVDKTELNKFLPLMHEFINSDKVKSAALSLDALMKADPNDINTDELTEVTELLRDWGMGSLGLSALNAIKDMHLAIQNEDSHFTALIPADSDGLVNGVAFTSILMMHSGTEYLSSVGVLPVDADNQINNMQQWKAQEGKLDPYEYLGAAQKTNWEALKAENTSTELGYIMRSMDVIDPDFGARKGAKRAITPFNYGAEIASINRAQSREFLAKVYEMIERDERSEGLADVINSMIRFSNANSQGAKTNYITPAMLNKTTMLPPNVEGAIRYASEALQGHATEQAILNAMKAYKDKRDTYSAAVDNSFNIFKITYDAAMRNKLNQKLALNPDQVLRNKAGVVLEGLSVREQKEVTEQVMKYMPVAASPFSIYENSITDTAAPYATYANTKVEGAKNEVVFSNNFSQYRNSTLKSKGGANTYFSFEMYKKDIESRGLGVIASYIQALDAYVALRVAARTKQVQNYHDAVSTNAFKLEEFARIQNEEFLAAVTTSHMGVTFSQGLLRALQGAVAFNDDLQLSDKVDVVKGIVIQAKKMGIATGGNTTASDLLHSIVDTFTASDATKMDMLANSHAIAQYATENGEYYITPEVKKGILNKKRNLVDKQIPNLHRQIDEIAAVIDAIPMKDIKSAKASFKQSIASLGEKPSFDIVASMVRNNLSAGKYANVHRELLDVATKVAKDNNTKVQIIKAGSDTSNIAGYDKAIQDKAPAFYTSTHNKNTIYIIEDNIGSVDSVLHEIIHAATALAVNSANSSDNVALKEAVKRIDDLRKDALKLVNEDTPAAVKYALQNVDEMLAEGLSNPTVIHWLDTNIRVPVGNRSTKEMGTLFREFVRNALGALYAFFKGGRKLDGKVITGYEALVIDAASVMENNTKPDKPANTISMNAPRKDAIDAVHDMDAYSVYGALDRGSLSKEHDDKLSAFMKNTVNGVYATIENSLLVDTSSYSPEQLWNNALKNGKAPYTTEALKAGFKLSAKEQFGVETIENVIQTVSKERSLSSAFDVMNRAYTTAKEKTTPADFHNGNWNTASLDDKELAQRKYDYIFNSKGADVVSRFAAMTIASEEVSNIMQMSISKDALVDADGNNKFEKFVSLVNDTFNVFKSKLNKGLDRKPVNDAVTASADQMAQLMLKSKNKAVNALERKYLHLSKSIDDVTIKARESIVEAMGVSGEARQGGNRYVNTARNIAGIASVTGNVVHALDPVNDFRDSKYANQRLGFLGELSNEISIEGNSQKVATKFLNEAKRIETIAERIRTVTKADLSSMFMDEMSKEQKRIMTDVVLRSDLQSLMAEANGNIETVIGYLTNKDNSLKDRIKELEANITPLQRTRAKDLARYMLTGRAGKTPLAKNALLIAMKPAAGDSVLLPDAGVVSDIDQLVTLYAIERTAMSDRKFIADVFNKEKKNKEGNGIERLIKYHNSLVDVSLNGVFMGTPTLYTKGYLPTRTNPNKSIVVARNAKEKEKYKNAMYVEVGEIALADVDGNREPAVMYMAEDSYHQRLLSGAIVFQQGTRKGTEIEMTKQQLASAIKDGYNNADLSDTYTPDTTKGVQAIPSYDLDGNITGYNYEISGETADRLLERDNDFDTLLAELYTQNEIKSHNQNQNLNVMDAIIDNYAKEYRSINKNQWVFVGEGATDPALLDAWRMIPKYARDHVYERTGRQGMYVNVRAYNALFGVRKYSLVNMYDKAKTERNVAERLTIATTEMFFGKKSRVYTAMAERGWQEAVKLVKDIVIIRNFTTALSNIVSNATLLLSHGVPPNDVVRHSIEAVKAGAEYRKNSAMLIQLQNKQRAGDDSISTQADIERIARQLQNNPLADLINAGMLSGIVEDVSNVEDEYSYKASLGKKVERMTKHVPKGVKRGFEHLIVSPNTPLYQFLFSATQYGDFSAKYTLYKYYTEKASTKLSKEEALKMADDNFINYNVPTSQGMQYMNDMGLFMFTKYSLRIQKALFSLLAKKPATAIAQAIMINSMNNAVVRSGIDPLFLNNLGNPMDDGALALAGVLDEPLPIKLLMEVF